MKYSIVCVSLLLTHQVLALASGVTSVRVQSSYDPKTRTLTYELTNGSSGAITAYAVRFWVDWSDGQTTWSSLSEGVPNDGVKVGRWSPGQKLVRTSAPPTRADASVTKYWAEVSSIVFDDLTYEGNWDEVQERLKSREEIQIARAYWVERLDTILELNSTQSQLKSALQKVIEELEQERSFHYFNGRVSRKSDGAAGQERYLHNALQGIVEGAWTGDVQTLLGQLTANLRAEYEDIMDHVSHNVAGKLVRKPRPRDVHR